MYSDLGDLITRQVTAERRSDRTDTLQTPPWQIGARVYRDTNQSVNDSSFTPISFSATRWDTDTMWAVGNPTRLTCVTAGYYLITGHVDFEANATGRRVVFIRLNGATYIAKHGQMAVTTGGVSTGMSIVTIYQLSATNYVELVVLQNSGGALNVLTSGNVSPEMAIHRLV